MNENDLNNENLDKKEPKKNMHIISIMLIVFIIFIIVILVSAIFCKLNKELKNGTLYQENQKIDIYENEIMVMHKIKLYGDILNLQTKKEISNISMNYYDGNKLIFKSYATIKLQGTSSLSYDKKNYTINLFTDDTFSTKNKLELHDVWGAQSKYCLKANWIDSTQARNIVSARLMAQIQDKYDLFKDCPNNGLIDGYPVEIYINDKYQGLYTCNIPKDEWMFNMDSKNPNHIVMCAESNELFASTSFYRDSPAVDGEEWSIEVGPNDNEEEIASTFEKLNRVIRFASNTSDEEFKNNFAEYLNLDSCLNYLCFLYIGNCTDNITKNMLLVTYDGKVWYPSLYDLDSTWGITYDGNNFYSATQEFLPTQSLLWKRIISCFPNEFKNRYNELRDSILSSENISNQFMNFYNSIAKEAWTKEHKKWPGIPNISVNVEQIINYFNNRYPYVDSVIEEI